MDDPDFKTFSEDMRAPLPQLTPEQEIELHPKLVELIHVQTERITADNEAAAALIPAMKNNVAMTLKMMGLLNKFVDSHGRMIAKLEMLDVDVTPYKIPPETGSGTTPS